MEAHNLEEEKNAEYSTGSRDFYLNIDVEKPTLVHMVCAEYFVTPVRRSKEALLLVRTYVNTCTRGTYNE
jgi:hypothetical protein